jgi:sugar/nucleoside kinase (ribokinase family)
VPDPDQSSYDVVAVGNAIVDVIATVDDDFLVRHDLAKDSMALVDEVRAAELYAAMPPGIEASGGSAANTAVGVASLGGRAAFVGKVCDDELGVVFTHDIRAAGVAFDVPHAVGGLPTARSLIVVTPDAHRTMNTNLGVAARLSPDDVDAELFARTAYTYCEGYLWDVDVAKAALQRAMRLTRERGGKVSFTLSDGFCVERHRDDFRRLVVDEIDILFANDAEIRSLYEVDHFDDALQRVRAECELAFLTRGAAGAVVVSGDEVHVVGAHPHGPVVERARSSPTSDRGPRRRSPSWPLRRSEPAVRPNRRPSAGMCRPREPDWRSRAPRAGARPR